MCVTCRSALFHHGMGRAVEKRMVGLPCLLMSVVLFFFNYFLSSTGFVIVLSP